MDKTPKKPARVRTLRTPARPDGEDWAPLFLRELARCCVIRTAAQKARIGRRTVYDRLAADPAFAAAFRDAMEDALDDLEAVARERAMEKSDRLLMYFLNRRYKQRDDAPPGPAEGFRVNLVQREDAPGSADGPGGAGAGAVALGKEEAPSPDGPSR